MLFLHDAQPTGTSRCLLLKILRASFLLTTTICRLTGSWTILFAGGAACQACCLHSLSTQYKLVRGICFTCQASLQRLRAHLCVLPPMVLSNSRRTFACSFTMVKRRRLPSDRSFCPSSSCPFRSTSYGTTYSLSPYLKHRRMDIRCCPCAHLSTLNGMVVTFVLHQPWFYFFLLRVHGIMPPYSVEQCEVCPHKVLVLSTDRQKTSTVQCDCDSRYSVTPVPFPQFCSKCLRESVTGMVQDPCLIACGTVTLCTLGNST